MQGTSLSVSAALLALAASATAQVPSQGPDYQCLSLTQLPTGTADNGTRLDQLADRLPEALKACEEGIRIRPNEARMHAMLARVRVLAGDRAGALAEARRAVELRSSESAAILLLGTLQARVDPAAALAQFREASRLGEKIARYNLGVLWANGIGVPRDPQDAANFFRDAARAGDTMAMLVIGQLVAQGAGAPQDRNQAEDWWRKAAETWQPEAVPDPARLVLAEPVLDTRALVAFYIQRAQAGEPWAQAWLGRLYDIGVWMTRDPAAAAFWYAKAGQAGHYQSQIRLANMYRLGIGVEQDEAESRRWGAMPQQAFCQKEMEKMAGADDCDRLAGDPYEPARTVVGLHAQCVVGHVQEAIAACRRAAAQHPGELRFRAQYARSLALAGRYDEAAREARAAAAKGSTAAMVLLGAMSQRGLGVPRDGRAALGGTARRPTRATCALPGCWSPPCSKAWASSRAAPRRPRCSRPSARGRSPSRAHPIPCPLAQRKATHALNSSSPCATNSRRTTPRRSTGTPARRRRATRPRGWRWPRCTRTASACPRTARRRWRATPRWPTRATGRRVTGWHCCRPRTATSTKP